MKKSIFLALFCGFVAAVPAFAQYSMMPVQDAGMFMPAMDSPYGQVQQYSQYAVPVYPNSVQQAAPVMTGPTMGSAPMMMGGQQYQWQLVPVTSGIGFAQPAIAAPVVETAVQETPIIEHSEVAEAPIVDSAPIVQAAPIVQSAPIVQAAPAPQVIVVQAPAPAPQIVYVPTPAPSPAPVPIMAPIYQPELFVAPPRRKGCCLSRHW